MRTLPLLLLAACATTATTASRPPQGGPRGLHASEHRDVARDYDQRAREEQTFPVATPMRPGEATAPPVWYRSWNTTTDYERLARVHRSEAAALEAAYVEACGTRDLKKVVGSPLVRHRTGGWNTKTGAVIYLSPTAGPAEVLLSDLKCHRAWMMLEPTNGMDNCPLDLPNLQIDARGDQAGITLVITSPDPANVFELQRRIAKQVEDARHAERGEN